MVKIMIKALNDFRRSIVRSLEERREQKENLRIWSEAKREEQEYRERVFARYTEGGFRRLFEPVKFLTFSQMVETQGGALKKGRVIYIAPDKIEMIRPHRGNFDEEHAVIVCGGAEYIVYDDYGDLIGVLERGVDNRSEKTTHFCV